MSTHPVIAIVGATGLVGNEMVVVLGEMKVPYQELRLFASEASAGEVYSVGGDEAVVEQLTDESFKGIDIALFATSAELSAKFVPAAVKAGAVAIDNSSHFRMQADVPLVVPEVNPHTVKSNSSIIANPNCSTIQLVPVLNRIHKAAGLKRVVVSTYQSVSGAGKAALDELWEQTLSIFNQRDMPIEHLPHQLAFNCIPQIDRMDEGGYSREEIKIVNESRKILGIPDLRITATAVRIPTLHSHAESVNVETERALEPADLVAILKDAPDIEVYADPAEYPMPIHATGNDKIHVGRIRRDHSVTHGLNLWIVSDNLRKGAATNAVQIAQLVRGAGNGLH